MLICELLIRVIMVGDLHQSEEMAEVAKVGHAVPESVLKKQKRNEDWALAKKQEVEVLKKKNAANRKLITCC
ncbi:hypothetical protein L6452_15117 [Arctium lappa]|uniref:Uncharacterized protein n=1 Tax=Arctium lappa TaxID=4217 RepID=A0ACB9CMW0_ARCLA|nr:hypothetical protein L6452_15117 [Arctium lappa]